MPFFLAKYNTQTTIYFPMVKRGVVDLAVTADWTPAASDTNVSKDGGAQAQASNTVAISTGSTWKLVLTATELSAAEVNVMVIDSATKAVEDQWLTVYTYGNASAKIIADLSDTVRLGLTALPNVASGSAGAIPTTGTGANQISVTSGQVILQAGSGTGQLDFTSGVVKANGTQILGGAIPAVNVTGVPLVDLKYTLGTISPAAAGSVRADAVTGAVGSVTGAVGSVTGAVGSLTTNNDKTGYALTSGERTSIADALLDETNGVETSWTLRQVLRVMFSALAGKLSGAATTTITTRDQADGKNRITATVDSNGNRSAITLDAS